MKGSSEVLIEQIDAMTRENEYPQETLVWSLQVKELTSRTVPAFQAKPGAVVLYHLE